MTRWFWIAIACIACDDGGPGADPMPDGPVAPVSDAGPDGGDGSIADVGVDGGAGDGAVTDGGVDAMRACPPSPAVEGARSLEHLTVTAEVPVGGGAATGAFLVEDLDGAPDGAPEFVVARGGRLEAFNAAGDALWNTPVLAINTLRAVADVDGDGRREVLATGGAGAWWFDALTGAELWRLDPAPFRPDDAPIAGVLGVRLVDLDADDLPDLYLTDVGCSGGGNGYGVAYSFAAGFDAPTRLGVVAEPRVGGRCARWHSLADVDGDGRPEVIRPDAQGIDAMAISGERVLCGPIPDTAGDTRLPHLPLQRPDGPAWAVFDRGRVLRLEARLGQGVCPDGRGTLQVAWQQALGDRVRPEGAAALDLDGSGRDALLTSVRADDRWRIVLIVDDEVRPVLDDALLEGVIPGDPPQLLVRQSPAAEPERFGALMLMAWGEPLTPIWPQPVVAAPVRLPVTAADRTDEFGALAVLAGAGPVVLVADPARQAAIQLRVIVDGRFVNRPLIGEPGGIRPVCGAEGCRADALAYSTAEGRIAVVDPVLALIGDAERPAVRAPTGLPLLDNVPGVGLVATTADRLAGLTPGAAEPLRWSVAVGRGRRPDPLGVGPDLLVIRDHATSPTTWLAVDGDGAPRWRHSLDPANYRALAGGLVAPAEALVYRYDFVEDMADWPPAEACADRTDPDIRAPLADCPDRPTTARMITALDAETGACRWRVTLRPTRCGSPTNQNVSRVDDTLFVTSTNELIALDAATGEETARASLGFVGVAGRGGGKVIRVDDALIRFGGNGPVDVHGPDLQLRWRADEQGIRGQSWLFRPALPVDDAVWISPAPRAPLHSYPLASMGEAVLPTRTLAFSDGVLVDPAAQGADVRSMQAIDRVTPDTDGVLLTTDERWLYALDRAGALAWSRAFDAAIGPPIVADLDADGLREMAIPVGDGRVLLADAGGPAPPEAVWDLPCPAAISCDPDRDIDTTERTDRLCAEWLPREGVDSYEVRVQDANGAILRDWFGVGPNTTAVAQGLALVPGARYFVQVRSRNASGIGAPATSDGVQVVDDPPPQVEISAMPAAIGPAEFSRIQVRAVDEELLAGWAMIVRTLDGELIQRLGAGPLAQPEFETARDWLADDRAKNPVPPATYEVIATFEDRAGNIGSATARVTVCDGPCP